MEISTLVNDYLNKGKGIEAQRAELQEKVAKKRESVERIRKQIQRLEDQERNLPYPSWFECILHPLAQALAKELCLEYDIYGPFGMRSQVTLYFMKDKNVSITDQPVKRLVLIPVNLGEGKLGYETGKAKDGVSEPLDHMRDPNGFSREVLPLPNDFKDILALIDSEEE